MDNKNKKTLESLKYKNEYYLKFVSAISDYDACLYDIELTKFVRLQFDMPTRYKTQLLICFRIITDKLTTVKNCITSDTPQLLSDMDPNVTFNYSDALNVIIEGKFVR